MALGISEVVGRASLGEGRSTKLYRALRLLMCATCGAEIREGMLFTRRKMKGIGVSIMPQCHKCTPFTEQSDKKERSALLNSLLTEQPGETPARSSAGREKLPQAEKREEKKGLDEAVERRLGPALDRARRSRSRK